MLLDFFDINNDLELIISDFDLDCIDGSFDFYLVKSYEKDYKCQWKISQHIMMHSTEDPEYMVDTEYIIN